MKIVNSLILAGKPFDVISLDIRRALNRPAVASLMVSGQPPDGGAVVLSFSVVGEAGTLSNKLWFTGYIQETRRINSQKTMVLCKDFTAKLIGLVPLALRNTTMNAVMDTISTNTGIVFNKPNADYLDNKAAYFYHTGSGLAAIRTLSSVFSIDDFVWQQQANGKVFCGSAKDAPWYDKRVSLPYSLFTNNDTSGTSTIAPMPNIRPGVWINDKQVLAVTLTDKMEITWKN